MPQSKEQKAAYMKEYRKTYTPAIRRKWRYGISSEDYDAMLEEQDNKCKICLGEFNDQTVTNIDHCHITNKVRGILFFEWRSLINHSALSFIS